MGTKTGLLLATVYLSVYSSVAIASDLGYAPGKLLVRFAPKAEGVERSTASINHI